MRLNNIICTGLHSKIVDIEYIIISCLKTQFLYIAGRKKQIIKCPLTFVQFLIPRISDLLSFPSRLIRKLLHSISFDISLFFFWYQLNFLLIIKLALFIEIANSFYFGKVLRRIQFGKERQHIFVLNKNSTHLIIIRFIIWVKKIDIITQLFPRLK